MNVFCVLDKHESCTDLDCNCVCHNQTTLDTTRVLVIDKEYPLEPIVENPIISDESLQAIVEHVEAAEIVKEILETSECEACPNIVPKKEIRKFGSILMCPICYEKEMAAQAANNTPEAQAARVKAANEDMERRRAAVPPVLNMNRILQQGRELDAQIQVRTDIFNAQTVAIATLKKAIDEDVSIENKNLALATELDNRYGILKTAVFELNQQVIEKTNEQKAIQTYLNQLVNRLRAEEREKFKQHDMTYEPKPAPKPKQTKGPKKQTIDKAELIKFSKELGLPTNVLQMMCVARNMTLQQAFDEMKKSMGK